MSTARARDRSQQSLVEVDELRVAFPAARGEIAVVDGLSWSVHAGETLAIVGESGSGKSIAQLAFFDLLPRDARVSARRMAFDGRELSTLSARERRALCGRGMSLVLQDPRNALHPRMTIGAQLVEVLELYGLACGREAWRHAVEALGEVGISEPERRALAYPHQLSGGMCQRAAIAIALVAKPRLIVADEPTTALDVTLAAQILELFADLQRRHGMALVLITHALGVVAERADRVLVVYAGRACETGPTADVLASPRHPYTSGLIHSAPPLDGDPSRPLRSIPGAPPDPARRPSGCAFAPRCAHAIERCVRDVPRCAPATDASERSSACWNPLVAGAELAREP